MKKGSLLRDALLMDLLEFGRVIHAEMHAISSAARIGRAVNGATLYCTTFPCHICATHIIASGIRKVVFIEPYPKSYAQNLHNSIVVQAGTYAGSIVQFAPFIGIAPFRFRELFERTKRKDEKGDFIDWVDGKPQPIVQYTIPTYLSNEDAVIKAFQQRLTKLKKKYIHLL